LGGSDLATKICLARLAELAFSALWGIKCNHVVSRLDRSDALSYRFYNTSTFMAQNNRESPFRVLSGECVCIRVANTGVVDLNPYFVGLWRGNFDIFNSEVFSGLPRDCRLAGDGLPNG
jgi:hypothetical protein